MSIKNKPKKNGKKIKTLRNFFEHRALWFYFLIDEARKKGINPDEFAPAAIRRCGLYHGARVLTGNDIAVNSSEDIRTIAAENKNCRLLKKKLFGSIGKKVFEMKFINLNDNNFEVDFHYCPLVNAWQKQGCTDEEIDKLCDWAMEGDRGIADVFGCELELKKTIAKGDGVCKIRFRRI